MPKRFLDLFSGSGSVSVAAQRMGYEVRNLDLDPKLKDVVTYHTNILKFRHERELKDWVPDVVWASPPCTDYSIAQTRYDRNLPASNRVVRKTLDVIRWVMERNPRAVWILENPQTGLLKEQALMRGLPYADADYCPYGFPYRKRTRFWTNRADEVKLKMCPGAGRCKQMEGNRHLVNIGNNMDNSCPTTQVKFRVPAGIVRELVPRP